MQIVISILLAAVVQRRKGDTFHILRNLNKIKLFWAVEEKLIYEENFAQMWKNKSPIPVSRRVVGITKFRGKKIVSQYLDLDFSWGDFKRSFPLFG